MARHRAWFGKAAESLGLSGEVDRSTFGKALEGQLPGGERLGTTRGGQLEHRPGWDVTFSAPKSVSIIAEVAGDRRLVGANDRAVRVALDYIERHGAAIRIRDGGAIRTVETGKLAVATFRHNTSRAHDPQLHTHSVILNATQTSRDAGAAIMSYTRRADVGAAGQFLGWCAGRGVTLLAAIQPLYVAGWIEQLGCEGAP